ncbi:MAG: diguanylate cyclase [Gemmatimonadales bacterium]|nr:diguanylate cyclase [Gemmatimonadales bacterium]
MSEPLDDPLAALRREYLAGVPARLEELRQDIAAFRGGQKEALASLKIRFHRLAGSGGSYGFPEISAIAREMEQWIATRPAAAEAGRLDEAVARLSRVSQQPQTPHPAMPAKELGLKWRALLIVSPGPEREQLKPALQAAGYEVAFGHRHDDPAALPPGERPHLVVISTGPGEGDPSAIASSWTNGRSSRPRAVVLIETLRAVAKLRAIAAGVDAVILAERMLEDLPRYARTLARIGPPPSRVLLVDPDTERAAEVAACLEEASIRVVRSQIAKTVPELLDREAPDLLLLGTGPPDAEGPAVAAMVRQDPRFHLLPIVFLGPAVVPDQMEALRAGADDFLAFPAAPELILQTVISRAERGRRLREALHRDDLTGLLNQVTLMAQLEHAVEHSRRHGGDVAFVVFDLDRFAEVNERFGQAVGDQVLLHVATVFRSNVRASDVIGRYGGEEFAMILRGGGSQGASVLAAKLRRVLGEQAATTAEGLIIPLHVSVGWAAFPSDGNTAGELVHGAVRALRMEKLEKT